VKDGTIHDDERDQYFGLSLRQMLHEFKWQTLVLLKALILQPKVSTERCFSPKKLRADLYRCCSSVRIVRESVRYSSRYCR